MRPPWSNGWELLGRLGDRGGAGRRRTGPRQAEGRSRRTGGGSEPTTSIRSAGGAFTNRMTAETLGVRADIACVPKHMLMGPEVVLTLFRSIVKVMPLNRRFKSGGIKGTATSVAVSSFELNHVCCCFTSASGLDSLFIEHTRQQDDIYPSRSLA